MKQEIKDSLYFVAICVIAVGLAALNIYTQK
jgi:hypothetical protein